MDTRNGPEARRRRRKRSWKVEEICERIRDEMSNMKGSVERGGPGGGGPVKEQLHREEGQEEEVEEEVIEFGCTNKMLTLVQGRDLSSAASQNVVSRDEKKDIFISILYYSAHDF